MFDEFLDRIFPRITKQHTLDGRYRGTQRTVHGRLKAVEDGGRMAGERCRKVDWAVHER